VLGHFSVMVRDIAQLFVDGPPVVSHAMGYEITKEELGGWQVHCRNGSVDNLAETEEEAAVMTKRFVSYLPSSVFEAPPVLTPDPTDPANRREEELFTIIPRKRTTTFDMRRAIRLMADRGSFFEIGPLSKETATLSQSQVPKSVRRPPHCQPMALIKIINPPCTLL
jgi:acetyl-CoA carboxylase carboxyltransferase component